MERSGTTLLSMIIGAHPLVAVPLATTGMWTDFARRLPRDFNGLATGDDIVRLVDAILAHERIRLWDAALDRMELLAGLPVGDYGAVVARSEEHTSELQSLMRISYAVFCLKKNNQMWMLQNT